MLDLDTVESKTVAFPAFASEGYRASVRERIDNGARFRRANFPPLPLWREPRRRHAHFASAECRLREHGNEAFAGGVFGVSEYLRQVAAQREPSGGCVGAGGDSIVPFQTAFKARRNSSPLRVNSAGCVRAFETASDVSSCQRCCG